MMMSAKPGMRKSRGTIRVILFIDLKGQDSIGMDHPRKFGLTMTMMMQPCYKRKHIHGNLMGMDRVKSRWSSSWGRNCWSSGAESVTGNLVRTFFINRRRSD